MSVLSTGLSSATRSSTGSTASLSGEPRSRRPNDTSWCSNLPGNPLQTSGPPGIAEHQLDGALPSEPGSVRSHDTSWCCNLPGIHSNPLVQLGLSSATRSSTSSTALGDL